MAGRDLNYVFLAGRLGSDPETRSFDGGTWTRFRMAVNAPRKTPDGRYEDRAVWVDVRLFGKTGEAFARYHKKGQRAQVAGRLEYDEWDDKATGQKRTRVYVMANEWSPAEWPEESTTSSAGGDAASSVDDSPF